MSAQPFDAVGCPQKPPETERREPDETERRAPNATGNGAGNPGSVPNVLERMGRAFGSGVQSAEYFLGGILQALPAAIYTTDAAGHITFYNEAAAELWGCRPELGKSKFCGSWKLYWNDGRPLPHDECPMALVLKQGRGIRGLEAVVERPDGTRIRVAPYPTPIFDDSGTLIGAVNMVVDISDRKRADADAQLLASIIESSDDAIISKILTASSQVGIAVPSGYSAIPSKRSSASL